MSADQHPEAASGASRLTVLQAHLAADCPDRVTCWAKDIHDAHCKHTETWFDQPTGVVYCRDCGQPVRASRG